MARIGNLVHSRPVMAEIPIKTHMRGGQDGGTLVGVVWMAFAGLLFVAVTVIVRYLGSGLPAVESAFIRYAIGLALIAPLAVRARMRVPRGKKLVLFAARGLAHALAVSLWFYAMARIPIADVIAIGYTTPIFVTIGAALFLGERLRLHRMVAVAAGFVGALVILRPGFHVIEVGSLAQLMAAPVFASSFLMAKVLTRDEDPVSIVVMLSVFCTLALAPGALAVWQTPGLTEVAWLGLVAIFATLGHYAQTRAYKAAQITATQPVWFLQLVWGVLFGWLLFDEAVDPFVIAGAAIIITAVTYISHRERKARNWPPREDSNL